MNSSDELKAMKILAYMVRIRRKAAFLQVSDIESKASSKEIDFFYRWCCFPC